VYVQDHIAAKAEVASIVAAIVKCIFLTVFTPAEFCSFVQFQTAVDNDGEIEWAAGYGVKETGMSSPVSKETFFQAASIAKPVVSVAALRMRDAGMIDLDENIQTYLSA